MSRISPQYKLTVLLLLLVALICVSSLLGRYAVRASDVLAACLGWMGLAPTVHGGAQVVMELRLPRIVGAAIAILLSLPPSLSCTLRRLAADCSP